MSDDREAIIRAQLGHTLEGMTNPPPARKGKVRDIYERDGELFLVASDRVSAYDVVLGTVPFKGAMLTTQAAFWLERAADILPTHLLEQVDPQVMRCRKAEPLAFEMVVRGYLAGSLLREPAETRGQKYGLRIDPDVGGHRAFPEPIITPTTKADVGEHDEPCSLQDLVASGVVSQKHLDESCEKALALFAAGSAHAKERGLILVDTKYELGLIDGELVLIDEVHTADSSRFWIADSYQARVDAGETPEMLDKERLRRWLRTERDYTGDGEPPELTDDVRVDLALHYWDLTERVAGVSFEPVSGDVAGRVGPLLEGLLAEGA
jgi:phosphoribosylaminoimidazole-succinocarboxamide synthase